MNEKTQKMGEFLNKASAIINRVNQISPKEPSKGQPTLTESIRLENVSPLGYEGDLGYSYNDQSTYNQNSYNQNSYNQNVFSEASKKLPQSILDSITQNPISEYQGQGGLSVLDSIMPRQQPQSRSQINESFETGEREMPTTEELMRAKISNSHQQPQIAYQSQPPIGSQIDYSLINSMIKTAISEEIQKLKRYMINESKQNSNDGDVIIKVGNGIKFITNNGNVYEGKVKLVGNLK